MAAWRPALRNVGALACLGLATAGCSSIKVSVDSPTLSGTDASVCRKLVNAAPQHVSEAVRRPVSPRDAYAAAWGDPPIVLRCGVGRPKGFDKFSTCQVTDGVGWYIPEDQITGSPTRIVMTTVGREPNVEVRIPADYFPPAATMVDLASAIKRTVPEVSPCR
jgi:hypothetical protein